MIRDLRTVASLTRTIYIIWGTYDIHDVAEVAVSLSSDDWLPYTNTLVSSQQFQLRPDRVPQNSYKYVRLATFMAKLILYSDTD